MEGAKSPIIKLKTIEEKVKEEEEETVEKEEPKPKLTRNEYMRIYMRKRYAKKREEEVKTKETLKSITETFINIINNNIRAFTGEQQYQIQDMCDTKRHNIREIAEFLNNTVRVLL